MSSTCLFAWSWTATLLLSLSGCGADGPGSCKIATAADVPLLGHSSQPMVVGRLRDQQVVLLLDTGAETSVVTPNAVAFFGLSVDRDNVSPLSGVGGTQVTGSAALRGLKLGQSHALDLDLPIGAGSLPDKVQGLPVLGLFGGDFLSNYEVDVDVPHHHFGMYDLTGCGDTVQPVSPPYFTLPFRLDRNTIMVDVKINGVPIEAELDTGAERTYITRADAERAGVTDEMMANDRVQAIHGVDDFAVEGHRHRFASLEFGPERLKSFPLTVGSSSLGTSLLGDEFFRLNRVWISYPRQMLYVQPLLSDPIFHVVSDTPKASDRP